MAVFLSEIERKYICQASDDCIFCGHKQALINRVVKKVQAVSLDKDSTTSFWHNIAEYLGDAAFAGAVTNDAQIKNYVKRNALAIASMPADSWIGPAFRERASKVRGHLETAHLSIALSLALDLCKDAFTAEEYALCADALKKHAIPLCRAWLDTAPHFINNWNAVLTCGVALPAAVLGLEDELEFCHKYLQKVADLLQSDGTYGEGLQYGNYYLWVFLLANEALIRSGYPSASLERAGRYLEYCHYNLLTDKPLEKWGAYKRPRSFNFDDSTVIFAPNPDLLALLGSRLADSMPQHAALARKIMERFYSSNFSQGPFDRTSFGFVPRAGWMTLLFTPQMTRDSVNIPDFASARAFKNGEAVIRTGSWSENDLAVALKAPAPEPLNSAGHRHSDFNSIQLFFGNERLLADPGHTCYRSLTRPLDVATENHSTCTFNTKNGKVRQRDTAKRMSLENGTFGAPVPVPGKLEFCCSCRNVSAIISEAAECYGEPIKLFRRTMLVCGGNAVFVIDDIDTSEEVKTSWTWCLNNRDGLLNYSSSDNKITSQRGNAGLAIFNFDLNISSPRYGFLHDAYHPEVDGPGRGDAGTAIHAGHHEKENISGFRRRVFLISADFYGKDVLWQAERTQENSYTLSNGTQNWQITCENDQITISDSKNSMKLVRKDHTWQFIEL